MTCSRPASRRSSRTPAVAGGGLDRPGVLLPAPARAGGGDCADPEASWGHRKNNLLRSQDELFYGYYLSAGIMMREENGPAVPELARRATVSSCRHDPVRAFAPVLTAMPGRDPARRHPRRLRLRPPRRRRLGDSRSRRPARSSSRTCTRTTAAPRAPTTAPSSPTGTCTARARPRPLLELGPLARDCHQRAGRGRRPQDRRARPLQARPHHRDDADGYHRVACPAAMGKIRCPLRPASMTLDRGPARDPAAPGAPPGLLHPADHHRPAGRERPRPRRNTTTRPRPGAAPTPAAPAPNAASPPPRTPPATTSPAAGAASWAWHP